MSSQNLERVSRPPLGNGGFTLMEVLVVVGLFGILVTTALPPIMKMRAQYHNRGAAWQVFHDLQHTRSAAITDNNQYRFIKLVNVNAYQIHDDDNNNGVQDDGAGSVIQRDVSASHSGTTIAVDQNVLTFLPNGRLQGLNAPTFTVTSSGGTIKHVNVDLGGRIHLY